MVGPGQAATTSAGTPASGTAAVAATPAEGAWLEALEQGDRGHVENKGLKTPGDVVKAWRSAETLVGTPANMLVRKPADPDNAEQMTQYYTDLGRPKTAEEYELPPSDVGQGGVDLAPQFRAWAFKAGLSQPQTNAIYAAYQAELQTIVQKQATDHDQHVALAERELKAEWGAEYEPNRAAVTRFFTLFGISDDWTRSVENLLASPEDPSGTKAMMKGAAKIGRAISEHRFPGEVDTGDAGFGAATPAAAQTQIATLYADPEFLKPFQDKHHPGHKAAVKKSDDLHKLAYPETRP